MAEQNVSAETIRQATGWFQGADGKWRFDGWTDSDNRKPVTGAAVRSGRGII